MGTIAHPSDQGPPGVWPVQQQSWQWWSPAVSLKMGRRGTSPVEGYSACFYFPEYEYGEKY